MKWNARLAVEQLEDRTVPTAFTVLNGLDDGGGSLRAAVALAAADPNPDADTITFAPSVTAVTLTSGQITLAGRLTIAGPAGGAVTIARSAAGGTPDFRLFEVAAGATVELARLTITNGRASDNGGGVLNHGFLAVTASTVSGNSADFGGGVSNDGGTVALTASNVSDNSAELGGGGLFNNLGTATVEASTFADNTAGGDGGGILTDGGTLFVTASTFSGNSTSNDGGGITIDRVNTVTVSSSTFSGNSATRGGGIAIEGEDVNRTAVAVSSSTFSNNSAIRGGGIDLETGTLLVSSSAFLGNSAGNQGGGILNLGFGTVLTVASSTFSANSAGNEGGGIASGGNLTVSSSTFTGNSAPEGGGIGASGATLTNTIVADSTAGGDLFGSFAGSHNLIEDDSGGAGLGKISGDPKLLPLADNGGPTLSHALEPDSPAIDAGLARFGVVDGQLSFPIGAFDIGAVESGGTAVGLVVDRADDVSADDGLTTLREAVALANANPDANRITFAPAVTTVTLTQGQLTLTGLLTIAGPAGGAVTVARSAAPGTPDFRVFEVDPFGTVQLRNLRITNGVASSGGGALTRGELLLASCVVEGNVADNGGGVGSNLGGLRVESSTLSDNEAGFGGAIWNRNGPLEVRGSTLEGNRAASGGGIGIAFTSGFGSLRVTSSTLSENTGGALMVLDDFGSGGVGLNQLMVRSSTLFGNTGGGIAAGFQLPLLLENTIVANTAGPDVADGLVRYGAGNLIGDGSSALSPFANLPNTDPGLLPLADNGGPTRTHAPQSDSPAVNAGVNTHVLAGVTTDQRGTGFLRVSGGTIDIGAFEAQAPSDIALNQVPLRENSVGGTFVATLTSTDLDPGDTFSYQLVDSAGGRFQLAAASGPNNVVLVVVPGAVLDFESTPTLNVTVRSTDSFGISSEKVLTIALTNVNETPVNSLPLGTPKVKRNKVLAFTGFAGIGVTDDAVGDIQVTLTVTKGTLSLTSMAGLTSATGSGTRLIVLRGGVAAINAALATLTFKSKKAGKDTLTIRTEDLGNSGLGGPLTDTDVVNLKVTL